MSHKNLISQTSVK